MKYALLAVSLAFLGLAIPGCGPGDPEIIAPVEDSGLTQDQMSSYEESMKNGGSSRSSAPK